MSQAAFALRGRNPDVLSTIANLSNDEVFTPPELANSMLDALEKAWAESHDGEVIWANKSLRFLDPFTKSGVFLREIASRLVRGLAEEIPDLQSRVDHILTEQIFGMAVTKLTSLLARRSLYCSKFANGEHSIASAFEAPDGNVWFERTQHVWVGGIEKLIVVDEDGIETTKTTNGRCSFCRAPQKVFDRDDDAETYAYAFIHTDEIASSLSAYFGRYMKFDVVIGNPPYQMAGGAGGSSDSSIYQLFVEQAQKLEPQFVSMVIPSRWLAGGRDMGDFRRSMLGQRKLRDLVDYPVSKDVFPGVEVKGGVCYFLWDREYQGDTRFVSIRNGEESTPTHRKLDEFDVFVRSEIGIGILRKVLSSKEKSITEILSADTPFGLATNFTGFHDQKSAEDIELHYVVKGKRKVGYMDKSNVVKNPHLIDSWKVLIPEAGSDGGQKLPDIVLGKPLIADPNSACTQTYLVFNVDSREAAESLTSYIESKFFRFLVSLRKITQHALNSTYTWVPIQEWKQVWADKDLYKKYGLTSKEQDFIESVIKTMGDRDD